MLRNRTCFPKYVDFSSLILSGDGAGCPGVGAGEACIKDVHSCLSARLWIFRCSCIFSSWFRPLNMGWFLEAMALSSINEHILSSFPCEVASSLVLCSSVMGRM